MKTNSGKTYPIILSWLESHFSYIKTEEDSEVDLYMRLR